MQLTNEQLNVMVFAIRSSYRKQAKGLDGMIAVNDLYRKLTANCTQKETDSFVPCPDCGKKIKLVLPVQIQQILAEAPYWEQPEDKTELLFSKDHLKKLTEIIADAEISWTLDQGLIVEELNRQLEYELVALENAIS